MALIDDAKLALNLSGTTFDNEITDLLASAELDLGIAGVDIPETLDAIVRRAEISYVAYHFEMEHGSPERSSAYKRSYDEQKSQLSMATGYTTW